MSQTEIPWIQIFIKKYIIIISMGESKRILRAIV